MVALNKEQEQMKEDKELLENFRKKDNLISNKDLKHFTEQINENKKEFLDFLKEKDYLEKIDNENYKIKDDILKKMVLKKYYQTMKMKLCIAFTQGKIYLEIILQMKNY